VDMPAGLAADLTQLTDALADPDADLAAMVAATHESLSTLISSALGVAITVRTAGVEVCVSTVDRSAPPASTSLAVPLSGWTDGTLDGTLDGSVVFYAATPGALVDLAADLGWLLGERESLVLDGDLPPRLSDQAVVGLHELSVIGQACGVLITRGRSTEGARAELDQAALLSGTTVDVIAERLIRDLRPANRPFR